MSPHPHNQHQLAIAMPLVRFRYNILRILVGTSNITVKLLALNNNIKQLLFTGAMLAFVGRATQQADKENTSMHILYSALLFTCSSHKCDA